MMSAEIGQDWRPKTLKELFIQWQSVKLESWSHTAHLKGCHASKGTKFTDLHPYIEVRRSANQPAYKAKKIFSS